MCLTAIIQHFKPYVEGSIPFGGTFRRSSVVEQRFNRHQQKTSCPSGQGVGLEIQWVLPAQVQVLSMSYQRLYVVLKISFNQLQKLILNYLCIFG